MISNICETNHRKNLSNAANKQAFSSNFHSTNFPKASDMEFISFLSGLQNLFANPERNANLFDLYTFVGSSNSIPVSTLIACRTFNYVRMKIAVIFQEFSRTRVICISSSCFLINEIHTDSWEMFEEGAPCCEG